MYVTMMLVSPCLITRTQIRCNLSKSAVLYPPIHTDSTIDPASFLHHASLRKLLKCLHKAGAPLRATEPSVFLHQVLHGLQISPSLRLNRPSQNPHPRRRISRIHAQRMRQSRSTALTIPRIHNQRAVEQRCRSCEFRQYEASGRHCFARGDDGFVAVAGDIFVAHEVHAVAHAGNEADVCRGVEGRELVGGDGGVEELDGDVVYFAWGEVRVCGMEEGDGTKREQKGLKQIRRRERKR